MSSVTIHKYSLYYYFFLPFASVDDVDLRPPVVGTGVVVDADEAGPTPMADVAEPAAVPT